MRPSEFDWQNIDEDDLPDGIACDLGLPQEDDSWMDDSI